jgi:membrane-bound lytic murein transglycosylase A
MRSSDRILGMLALCLCGLAAAPTAGARAATGETVVAGPFTTRLGTFTPQPWTALAGWPQDSHSEALAVFRQTCSNLQRRETWRATCLAAKTVSAGPGGARAFFEREFVPYLVTPRDHDKEGLMTGYFEPVLDGSPVKRPPFVVPVHGAPADLLYLDSRRWQGMPGRGASATIVDDQVVPASPASAATAGRGPSATSDSASHGDLVVDAAVFDSEPLDRRHRVRRDGNRIVPYWTRQEIEAGLAVGLRAIAWVEDAQALYLMQVQGTGTIRMPDGRRIRLSYADQNGHPFRPRRTAPASRTRGLPGSAGADAIADATPVSPRALEIAGGVRHRSIGPAAVADEDVSRIVDALLAQPPGTGSGRTTRSRSRAAGPGAAPAGDDRVGRNLSFLVAAQQNDPSYVFFQAAPADGGGPVGALGVPLTATRSIAVDPRSTPLGAPVFIEAERDDSAEPLRRLMIAQDTGGAIRGALRADFFWGTGPQAGAQALRTKDPLSMWVLLPRAFVPPRTSAIRTRGIGGGAASSECVAPDPEYCLD